jgi:serine/threonine-protein kinase
MQGDPFGWVGHTVADKFRVDAVVAEGGFGVVYRALHVGFDARVALKCLKVPARLQGADRDKFLEAFLAEGRLLHQLSRSTAGIVQALDVGAAISPDGTWTPYLALEWLDGAALDVDLRERARRGLPGRSLGETVALLDSAARAIALAHEQGVAHRDLKPANLFVAEVAGKRVCKVLDFGIAKVLGDVSNLTRALQETGVAIQAFTPLYGAPEQFDRKYGATGPWTDVFAFALVLVEVMSGRPALDGGDTSQLFVSSMRTDRRPTPRACGVRVSDAVEQMFTHALAVDPKARFMSLGPFWQALVAEAARAPGVDSRAPPAYAVMDPALAPTGLAPTGLAPTGLAPTGLAPTGLAPTGLAPTRPGTGMVPTGLAPTGLAPTRPGTTAGPSTTGPQIAPLPSWPPPGARSAPGGAARGSRAWIAALAAAGVVVVSLLAVIVVLVLRVPSARHASGAPGLPGLPGLPGGGAGAAALRATATQKTMRKDPTCEADFQSADRLDPAGANAPGTEAVRALCEMVAGKCEAGRKRYRASIVQNNPAIQGANIDNAVNAAASQNCPHDQQAPEERLTALVLDVSGAYQRNDANQCIADGNDLVAVIESVPDRPGPQQATRSQAASALTTVARCAAKGGRCDDAHNFYRTAMHVLAKQQTPTAIETAFRNQYSECARK